MEALALLVGLYLLGAPAMGIVAYLALRKSRGEVRQLRARLTAATDGLDELTAAHTALRAELGLAPAPSPAPSPEAGAETPTAEPSEAPTAESSEPSEAERAQAAARAAFEKSLRGEPPEAAPPPRPHPPRPDQAGLRAAWRRA